MTIEVHPRRLSWIGFEYIDARMFLCRHHKSKISRIKVFGDGIDSVVAEVRKEIGSIREVSEFILTIVVRDEDILYLKDVVNLLETITKNRQGINCLWGVAEDPDAEVNFRVSIYAAQ